MITHHARSDKRDLRFTTAVLLAGALANEQRRTHDRGTVAMTFTFTLLAAANAPLMRFPDEGWRDANHLLAARVDARDGELRLTLQAQGYAALNRVAGREARLTCPGGAIDQWFRFDACGYGLVVLRDQPEIHLALRHFQVLLH